MGELKTIVVWRLDRLWRSSRDGINTRADRYEKRGRVVSVNQLDLSGATGRLIAEQPAFYSPLKETYSCRRTDGLRAGLMKMLWDVFC